MSFCKAIETIQSEEKRALHKNYHDNNYGFLPHNDNELFCRLIMEINQAGLSWETILREEASFRKAYSGFDIEKVAPIPKKTASTFWQIQGSFVTG